MSRPKIGWSGYWKLLAGDPLSEVGLQADFPGSGPYVLQFSKGDSLSRATPVRAEALVQWSVEGNYITRRFSLSNGLTVSGVGQAVKVKIRDVSADFGPVPSGAAYDVSVQVSPGLKPSSGPPPLLFTPDCSHTIAAERPLARIPIPADAGASSFIVQAVATDYNGVRFSIPQEAITLRQLQNGQSFSEWYLKALPGFCPIVPGADSLEVSVQFASLSSAVRHVCVNAFFGIDG